MRASALMVGMNKTIATNEQGASEMNEMHSERAYKRVCRSVARGVARALRQVALRTPLLCCRLAFGLLSSGLCGHEESVAWSLWYNKCCRRVGQRSVGARSAPGQGEGGPVELTDCLECPIQFRHDTTF